MKTRTALTTSLASTLALAATFAAEGRASAQEAAGYAVNRFEPSERGSDWFANESLDLRGKFRPALGVVGDYSYRPLVLYSADRTPLRSIVRNNLFAHVGGSFVLFERLRLAASLPVQMFADGHAGTFRGTFYPSPPNEQGVGDLRLGADLRLFGEYGGAITGAIGAQVWAPTGQQSQWAGDGEWRLRPRAAVAGDIGSFTYAAQVGVAYRARGETFAGSAIGSELTFAVAAGLRLADQKLVIGPELFGSTVFDDAFGRQSTPLEGILGAHYLIGDQVRIGGGVGTGLTPGFGSPEFRALLNAEWHPGVVVDTDGDGIPDRDDACPNERGVVSSDPAKNGCPPPPPPSDKDGDGVPDTEDACVDTPGVKTDDPRTNGCPADADGDGILDKDDACPNDKGQKSDDPAMNGCPDMDGDGVFDKVDACPKEPGPKTADPKTNGCPDPDRDKDGVLNDVDACPDEPGKPDPDPKRNGCPKAFVKDNQIRILDQVKFATGSAKIVPGKDSEEVLGAVIDVLGAHPEIAKIRVEGHTDNKGNKAMNKKLSADRAASVVKWLVGKGIAKDRLVSAGFGDEKPVDTNDTDEGRKNNRRVEFHIEGQAAQPAEAPAPAPKP